MKKFNKGDTCKVVGKHFKYNIGTIITVKDIDCSGDVWTTDNLCIHPHKLELYTEQVMKKRFKNKLAITGDKILLEAMAKKLDELGYRSISPNITPNVLCLRGDSAYDKQASFVASNYQNILDLPLQWNEALQLASEVEEEDKLEVGRWYVNSTGDQLVKCTKISTHSSNSGSGPGIVNGEWGRQFAVNSNWNLASDEIVKDFLVKEAIKRGFKKGVSYKYPNTPSLGVRTVDGDSFNYNSNWGGNSDECLSDPVTHNVIWSNDGGWAEIVSSTPDITVNDYTGKFYDNHVEFGCAVFSVEVFQMAQNFIDNVPTFENTNRKVESIQLGKGKFNRAQIKAIVDYYEAVK